MTHDLKIWPEYFQAVQDGRKTFEIRANDRNYLVGHILRLREWCPRRECYTGAKVERVVTYITDWEQKPGNVVMAMMPC